MQNRNLIGNLLLEIFDDLSIYNAFITLNCQSNIKLMRHVPLNFIRDFGGGQWPLIGCKAAILLVI